MEAAEEVMAGIMSDEEKRLIRMHVDAVEKLEAAMTALPGRLVEEAVKFKKEIEPKQRWCRNCGCEVKE